MTPELAAPTHPLDVSVVVPAFNEAESLDALHEKLTEALRSLGSYEIIFVDDGSTDGTGPLLDALVARDPAVGVIHFRRNFGKAAALSAGFEASRGRTVFMIDADLQDDPAEFPRILAKLDEGYDLVNGWKAVRHDPLGKRLPSWIFNAVVRKFSGLDLNDFNCGLKGMRREAAIDVAASLYGELHRYIAVLAHWRGFRVCDLPVKHHPRRFGSSKYGLERLARGFFDVLTVLMLTRYRTRPLHFFGSTGLSIAGLGTAVLGYLSVAWLLGAPIGTRPLWSAGLLLVMVGVQLFGIGLLAEMVGNLRPHGGSREYAVRATTLPRTRPGDDPAHLSPPTAPGEGPPPAQRSSE